jgi:hypothetical protein
MDPDYPKFVERKKEPIDWSFILGKWNETSQKWNKSKEELVKMTDLLTQARDAAIAQISASAGVSWENLDRDQLIKCVNEMTKDFLQAKESANANWAVAELEAVAYFKMLLKQKMMSYYKTHRWAEYYNARKNFDAYLPSVTEENEKESDQ